MSENERIIPINEIDANFLNTEPGWQNLNQAFRDRVTRAIITLEKNIEGKEVGKISYDDMSSVLNMYTRDIRLSNLGEFNGEVAKVTEHFGLAGSLFLSGYADAAIFVMNEGISITEVSQAKKGFLRKISNTIINKMSKLDDEPQKKGIFGNKRDDEQ